MAKKEIEHTSTTLGSQNMKSSQRMVSVVEPYELPEGWKWISIGECCEKAFSGKSPKYSKEETLYKIIGQQANQRYGIDLKFVKFGTQEYAEAQADFYYLQYNDVILNTLGTGSIGRSGIYKYHEKILTDGHPFVFRTGTKYSPDLLFYYLRLNEQEIINTANGSTNQKFLSLKTFSKFPIPLPPTLAEQQRIVKRIESMFAKLDEAKEKAQNVIDGFETRKAAILHKTFTNQLKIENGKLKDEDWEETALGNVIKLLSGQDFKPDDYNDSENGIPYITGASNFADNHVIINRWTEKPTVIAQKNDVLLVCKGSGYGKTIIADFSEAHIARQIMALRPNKDISNRFIYYLLQNNYDYLRNGGQGLIPGIARNVVLSLPIKLPPFNYQLSIVNFLDSVLEKENKAKQAAEAVLEQIDLLKKSILARAFRGEL